eukprot:4674393-Alexandrium_andersonii.AAC.1
MTDENGTPFANLTLKQLRKRLEKLEVLGPQLEREGASQAHLALVAAETEELRAEIQAHRPHWQLLADACRELDVISKK